MLTLDATQWQTLAQYEAANFADAVTAQYLAERPDMANSPGLRTVSERMRAAYAYALELGFTSTPHIVKLMYLATDSRDFYTHPLVDAQLRKPGYPPEQRFDDYLAVVNHKLKGLKAWPQ